MKPQILLGCAVCLLFFHIASAQEGLTIDENPCTVAKTCGECMAKGTVCTFCKAQTDSYVENNNPRCNLIQMHMNLGCPAQDIVNPKSYLNKTKNDPVQQTKNDPAVQISPQEIKLVMRPNDEHRFKLTFKLAENYPVDLYYLMDLSYSMKDDKARLAELGVKIAEQMRNITQNFRLGFGSFVDKVVMPYVSMAPSKINLPCEGCESPYGFKNVLKLNSDSNEFKNKVSAAKVSGNLDSPEGGFDAIMQSVVCDSGATTKESIGWRERSRRMLLFSTDASFHFAGDGKLGGIVEPNDGSCHLDSSGLYTESTNLDYPSISQIAAKVKEKSVNIIFAVTKDQVDTYKKLENFIPGSAIGELANDSSNIVSLVRTNYEKITSKVQLVTEDADMLDINFYTSCKGTKLEKTNTCYNLSIGDSVTFDVTISAKECPTDNSATKRKFVIKPVGLPDKLEIDLDLLCSCPCETEPTDPALNKEKCNGHGEFRCGMCECSGSYYGNDCSCDAGSATPEEKEKDCIHPNSTSGDICSGNGKCECGKCKCDVVPNQVLQRFNERWCQCNDFSCPRYNKDLCGGFDHGTCKCGECICKEGWSGESCSCSTNTTGCLASNGKICNGEGVCECNSCKCNATSQFIGDTCEDCKNCEQVCRTNMNCVLCVVHNSGEYTAEECNAKCREEGFITQVPELSESQDKNSVCEFKDQDDCLFFFSYAYSEGGALKITAQEKKECPKSFNVLAIVLGVIGGIVAVGLAMLLVWKLVTTISDKRELARFEKETQNAKWDTGENPIYKQATSIFSNPTYGGR